MRIEYDDLGTPILVGIDDDNELEEAIQAYEEIQKINFNKYQWLTNITYISILSIG